MSDAASAARDAHAVERARDRRRVAFAVAVLVLLVAGSAVRLPGVSTRSLWLDEATIANPVSRGQIAAYLRYPMSVRPFGYLVVSGWIAAIDNSELALRLSSLVPSLLALVLLVPLARELFRSRVFVLLALFSIAFNGWLIGLAREFKPYALESFLVVLWLLAIALVRRRGSTAALVILGATMAVAPLFGHGPALFVPIDATVAVAICWRRGWRRAALCVGGCATLALVLMTVQYALVGTNSQPALSAYWMPSFFVPERDGNIMLWAIARTAGLVKGFVRVAQDPTACTWRVVGFLCLLGWLLGVIRFVVRREVWLFGLLVAPLAPPLMLGLLGRWPFGPERVNLDLVVPVTLTSLLGWELVLGRASARTRIALALLFVALQLPLDRDAVLHQESRFGVAEEEVAPALLEIAAREAVATAYGQPPAGLVLNRLSAPAVLYYARVKRGQPAEVRALVQRRRARWAASSEPAALRTAVRAALARHQTVWIVLAHFTDAELGAVREVLDERAGDVFHQRALPGVWLFGVRGRRPPDAPAPRNSPAAAPARGS